MVIETGNPVLLIRMAFQVFSGMHSLAPTTDAFEFIQFYVSHPSFSQLLLLGLLLFCYLWLSPSWWLWQRCTLALCAPGPWHGKPHVDGCQHPFSSRRLQKAASPRSAAGSHPNLQADCSPGRGTTIQTHQSLHLLLRIDTASVHHRLFQLAGI